MTWVSPILIQWAVYAMTINIMYSFKSQENQCILEGVMGFTEEKRLCRYHSLNVFIYFLSHIAFPIAEGFLLCFVLLGEFYLMRNSHCFYQKCVKQSVRTIKIKISSFSNIRHQQQENLWLLPSLKKKKMKARQHMLKLTSVFWNPANTAEQEHSNTSSKLKVT